MKQGTKSVLFGVHQFLIHPWFVAAAWRKLYGFPFDPRLWVAFFVHDIGYIGKPNMDGAEGEDHPILGARIMQFLFGWTEKRGPWTHIGLVLADQSILWLGPMGQLSLLHSRYFAKKHSQKPSRLCMADKLSFALTPRWLYLPLANASGEIHEYLQKAQKADSAHWVPTGFDQKVWHAQLCDYMNRWVAEHKDGCADTWTDAKRNDGV